MTTIAYRDGILAADTAIHGGGCLVGEAEEKIFEHEGSLFGVTGSLRGKSALKKWLADGRSIENLSNFKDDDLEIMEIDPKGNLFFIYDDFLPVSISAEFHAIGSGYRIALGALDMGATATMAVEICIKRDCYTAGKVISLRHRAAS